MKFILHLYFALKITCLWEQTPLLLQNLKFELRKNIPWFDFLKHLRSMIGYNAWGEKAISTHNRALQWAKIWPSSRCWCSQRYNFYHQLPLVSAAALLKQSSFMALLERGVGPGKRRSDDSLYSFAGVLCTNLQCLLLAIRSSRAQMAIRAEPNGLIVFHIKCNSTHHSLGCCG